MWSGNMMGWGWQGGGWSVFGTVFMLLWWALIILGIVMLVRWLAGAGGRRERQVGDRALEILRERYARGEIGKEEFDSRKRDLGGG